MKNVSYLLLVAASLVSCATSSTAPGRAISVQPHRIYWDAATGDSFAVKITRDSGKMGSLCLTRIAFDGKNVADIGRGESVLFKVSPGTHTLSAWQISAGGSSGRTFCDNIPQRKEATVSGVNGDNVAYRYSYEGSGEPLLTVTAF